MAIQFSVLFSCRSRIINNGYPYDKRLSVRLFKSFKPKRNCEHTPFLNGMDITPEKDTSDRLFCNVLVFGVKGFKYTRVGHFNFNLVPIKKTKVEAETHKS